MPKTRRRDHGSGSVYRRRDGYWAAVVQLGYIDGKRRRKTVTARTKAGAIAKLRGLQQQQLVGAVTTGTLPTLGEWLQTWLDTMVAPRVAAATLRTHRSYVEQHITPHLGHLRVDKIRPEQILRWHQTLRLKPVARHAGTLAQPTILRAHAVLSKALMDAMRLGYINHNPAQRVDRPTRGGKEPRFLNLEQATRLLDAVQDDPYGSRWGFALLTGQRQGETLGLRWSHINLDAGVDDQGRTYGVADIAWKLEHVEYQHGCQPRCGHRFAGDCLQRIAVPPVAEHIRLDNHFLTRPKAGVRKLVVLIPALVAWLNRHYEEQLPGRHDLVWSRPDGEPVNNRTDYEAWRRLLGELDLPPVTLHSARHTCVSLLLSLGEQEATIMQLVGHSTVAAARQYQHLDAAARVRAASRLGEALQLEVGNALR
jgi:integrase